MLDGYSIQHTSPTLPSTLISALNTIFYFYYDCTSTISIEGWKLTENSHNKLADNKYHWQIFAGTKRSNLSWPLLSSLTGYVWLSNGHWGMTVVHRKPVLCQISFSFLLIVSLEADFAQGRLFEIQSSFSKPTLVVNVSRQRRRRRR